MTVQEHRDRVLESWRPLLATVGPTHIHWLKADLDMLIKFAYQEGRETVLEEMGGEMRERMKL